MKTMTCRQMGGMCDEALTAGTSDEMMAEGMVHLESAHPEMAASIKAMPKDDPQMMEWGKKFSADWASTPDNS